MSNYAIQAASLCPRPHGLKDFLDMKSIMVFLVTMGLIVMGHGRDA